MVSERGGDGHILRGDIIQFWLLLFSCKVSQGWRMARSHVASQALRYVTWKYLRIHEEKGDEPMTCASSDNLVLALMTVL